MEKINHSKSKEDGERKKNCTSSSKRERTRDVHMDKNKEKIRRSERERSSDDKRRHRDRESHRDRDREKEKKERKVRDREKEREREREREREKEKARRIEEREKEREKERVAAAREKRRELEREEDEEHDRKRRRMDTCDRDRRRQREGSERRVEEVVVVEEETERNTTTREEEQRKLDEEMDKRRRRVQEWQELKLKKEEQGAAAEEQPKSGKNWTLEGEESDADEEEMKPMDAEDNEVDSAGVIKEAASNGEDEIDPLDAFMNSMVIPEVEKLHTTETVAAVKSDENGIKVVDFGKKVGKGGGTANGANQVKKKGGAKNFIGRIIPGEDSDYDYEDDLENDGAPKEDEDEDDEEFIKRVKKTKAEKLSIVDHSKIDYPPFRKNFYIEAKDIKRMMPEEVTAYRKQLELRARGKDVPKPIKTWSQTGLTSKILDTIKKMNFERPMSIQAQAFPVIMSGRDCIGIAKTGSGKTLAFVLPMLRHIKDQPPVVHGDGPIGLIMAPTRELVQQIHSDIKKFAKVMDINCVPVYGGSGVAQQISDLKRGTEIVVCTPGRMIDILCTSSGKITNLRRVTYLVMDEADRMFDMGFEPQITRIVQNMRPDRQTVLFSATFPRQVEALARKILNNPVEIQVGGKSVVNKDITQFIEVRQESERFFRLLELLGEWHERGKIERGKILVFVHSQDKCDALFKDLIRHGYPCLSLHGAKDQTDRESTIADFKSNVCNLMIATSVAARGLDVKELDLVVNFDAPNHYEDYVHRVGRTGRAGRKGRAVTFISEDDARYAPDLVKALQLSEQAIPEDLKALSDGFMAKIKKGTEQAHGTGYGGSGFKFNEEEDEARRAAKKAQAREYGFEEDKSDSDSEDEGVRKAGGDLAQAVALAHAAAIAAATRVANPVLPAPVTAAQLLSTSALPAVTIPGAGGLPTAAALPDAALPGDAAARAAALAAAMNLQHNLAKIQADAMPEYYEAELEINDFPQNARWKVTHKETLGPISEWTGASITTRGQYYPPGKIAGPGERKLYLFIEGSTESSVKKAKVEVKRVLEDYTAHAISLPGAAQPGKYSVI